MKEDIFCITLIFWVIFCLFGELMRKINNAILQCIASDTLNNRYYLSTTDKRDKRSVKRLKTDKRIQSSRFSSKKIALIGLFCAIAYIFTLIGGLLPISVAGFLKYDPKDIIVAISGFILGPSSALAISVLTALLELVTGISTTGFYGLLMNIISTASFACIASYAYKKDKTLRGAIIGLICATAITTGLMLLWNFLITPFYMSVPRDAIAKMLPTTFLPFNLVKYGMNSCLALLIYKPVVTAMRKSHIIESTSPPKARPKLWITLITLFVLTSLIFCLLILAKII